MGLDATVYYDYLCPYAYRLCTLLDGIKADIPGGLSLKWKTYSLEQQISRKGPDFLLWEHPETPSLGVAALIAAKAAGYQGIDLFLKFHFSLFDARHNRHEDISLPEVLAGIAAEAGLDAIRFNRDRTGSRAREDMADDHLHGKQHHNLFGVPFLAFNDKNPVYIKLTRLPDTKRERLSLFNLIHESAVNRPYLMEIKRPEPILL